MPVPLPPLDDVSSLIREVSAAEIMPRFGRLGDADRWRKRHGSVVTAADVAAEEFLARRLPELVASSLVVGEEMSEESPGSLDALDGDAPVWLVDPVDGTRNFVDGKPGFAVMVALVVRRQAVAGWIYRPVEDAMYVAEAGAGAFRDGDRLRVAAAAGSLAEHAGSLGGFLRRKTDLPDRFARITASRCIGVDYCALADGEIHFAHYRGVSAWDHAAGVLIHAEAGGFCRSLDRTPYRVGAPGEGGILLAPDPAAWEDIRDPIAEALAQRRAA